MNINPTTQDRMGNLVTEGSIVRVLYISPSIFDALLKKPHGYWVVEQSYLLSFDPQISTANDNEWGMEA